MLNADLTVSMVNVTPAETCESSLPCVSVVSSQSPAVGAQSIGDVIRDISQGVCKAEDLNASTRQECVLALSMDGLSNDEIASLLRISGRTVTRDRKAARKTHALKPDRELGDELLGELQSYVLTSVRRLSRLCNDATAPHAVRVRADEAIGRIYQRFVDQVRRFSYASTGSRRLELQAKQEQMKTAPPVAPSQSQEERFMAALKQLAFGAGAFK